MTLEPLPARVNHRKLATETRKLEGVIPLKAFERLSDLALSSDGEVEASLSFRKGRKRSGLLVGRATATIQLQCQNCMQPMIHQVEAKYRHQLVSSEEALLKLEEHEDGIICSDEVVQLTELLEDELLLSLPMAAKHKSGECSSEEYEFQNEISAEEKIKSSESGETYKPFAGLAELTESMNLGKGPVEKEAVEKGSVDTDKND